MERTVSASGERSLSFLTHLLDTIFFDPLALWTMADYTFDQSSRFSHLPFGGIDEESAARSTMISMPAFRAVDPKVLIDILRGVLPFIPKPRGKVKQVAGEVAALRSSLNSLEARTNVEIRKLRFFMYGLACWGVLSFAALAYLLLRSTQ